MTQSVWIRSVHVRFAVDRVALGQVFLRVRRFCPATIVPSVVVQGPLHAHVLLPEG